MENLSKPFYDKIKNYQAQLAEKNKISHYLSNLRLLSVAIALYAVYKIITQATWEDYFLGGVAIIGYVILALYHHQLKEELRYIKGLIAINNKYIARISGEWVQFKDTGEELAPKNHLYAFDLDIVGEKSLFQMINTTKTWHGRQALVNKLLGEKVSPEEIAERQQAILELSHSLDFMQEMEYLGSRQENVGNFPGKLLRYSQKTNNFLLHTLQAKLIYIFPFLAIAVVIWGYFQKNNGLLALGIGIMIGQYLLTMLMYNRTVEMLEIARSIGYELASYQELIAAIEKKTFASERLNQLKAIFISQEKSAYEGIAKLQKLTDYASISLQPITSVLCNALWLWDFKSILALEKWRSQFGLEIENWLSALGEWESYMSLAVLTHITHHYTFPEVNDNVKGILAQNIGHPFIPAQKNIYNDVHLKDEIWLVTGSNMSGKTTFLRTLGINLVLAYSGAPVIATQFQCDERIICTSMRLRDDLKEGVSTFYAELLRIKQILEVIGKEEKTLFLIDEIFRGTNSKDRILGAKAVLSALNQPHVIGAMTTHDLELCSLEESYSRMVNYHFTDQYLEDKLYFDYRLKSGFTTATNAQQLMKMVGIPLVE